MKNWLAELATHYEKTRLRHPDEKLAIMFDIDGSILDTRYMVYHVLQAYDHSHQTCFFRQLQVSDIKVHPNRVEFLLVGMGIDPDRQSAILKWYTDHRWSPEILAESYHPQSGVLEVIRWFQLQPQVYVVLNTGRPEVIREDTLPLLNKLAAPYRVQFSDALLYMNHNSWNQGVQDSKVVGVRYFQAQGYRVLAMVDNEPENLNAVAVIDQTNEMLLLHANMVSESERVRLPRHAVRGKVYDLTELVPEKALPRNVQFVWHGLNDEGNLRQFLASDVEWGECDIHMHPRTHELVLHHDPLTEIPADGTGGYLTLNELLARLYEGGRAVKLDLKGGGKLIDRALELVEKHGFDHSRLWFNGEMPQLREDGIRRIASAYPDSIIQCPISFMEPLVYSVPDKAKEMLDTFQSWGVNRFSISWLSDDIYKFFDQMNVWGLDVNIYGVFDLETFLKAVLLMPCSVTSDFNFPKWHYYGRGSGMGSIYYEYRMYRTNHQS